MTRMYKIFAVIAALSLCLSAFAYAGTGVAVWESATSKGEELSGVKHDALITEDTSTSPPTTFVEVPVTTITLPIVAVDEPPLPRTYTYPNPDIDQWHDLAMQAGFADKDWKWLSCVINRETGSTGRPDLHNGEGRDDSYGLMQLNMRAHKKWVGPLVDYDFNRLYDPLTNLTIAYTLYEKAGRSPWRNNCSHAHTSH